MVEGYPFGSFRLFGNGEKVSLTFFRFDGNTATFDPERTPIFIFGSVVRFMPVISPERIVNLSRLPEARWKIFHLKPRNFEEQKPTTETG